MQNKREGYNWVQWVQTRKCYNNKDAAVKGELWPQEHVTFSIFT